MYQGHARGRQPVLACPLPSARTMVRQAEPVSWWIPAAFTAVDGATNDDWSCSSAGHRAGDVGRSAGKQFPPKGRHVAGGHELQTPRIARVVDALGRGAVNRPGHRADRSCRRRRPSRPRRGFPSHRLDWHRRLPHRERHRRHRRSCRQIPSRPPLPCPPFPLHHQVPPLRRRQRPSCRRRRPFPRCRARSRGAAARSRAAAARSRGAAARSRAAASSPARCAAAPTHARVSRSLRRSSKLA